MHLTNLAALANEVAGWVELLFQARVFIAQGIEGKNVFESDRCYSGDGVEEVNVIFAKWRSRVEGC